MRIFAERQPLIGLAALAYVVLNNLVAGMMFLAVYGFDLATLGADPGVLPDRGAEVAALLRWGGVIDMVGYLALAPVVLYLDGRLKATTSGRVGSSWLVGLLTFSGLGFVLVGSIGAVLMASVGPALLQAPTAGSAAEAAARVAFWALATSVYVGLWGTLELFLYGVWLIGVGWLGRAEGRVFAWLAAIGGVGALAYSARSGLSGRTPAELSGPLDVVIFAALGFGVVWVAWLAARLWLGR